MVLQKRKFRLFLIALTGIVSILIIQTVWLHYAYQLTRQQLMVSIQEAFEQAYRKEQTYREQITPMNIYCLADLFPGMLHDKDIRLYFVIERFDIHSGEVLESSLFPGKKQPEIHPETTIVLNISEKESIRAVLQLTPAIVLWRMTSTLIYAMGLSLVTIVCLCLLYRYQSERRKPDYSGELPEPVRNLNANHTFSIGRYSFDPDKNELQGFGETVQLNKKENAILYALCMQCGNIVERSMLLENNWGSNGIIYSRSLDTYITTLRKYFKKDAAVQIVTIKGVGYKLVC